MYLLIIQWSILSLILIVIIHYLYSFFQSTLTIPKIKDLVNRPVCAYKEIYETINKHHCNSDKNNLNDNNLSTSNQTSNQNMKNELKNYLNNLSSLPQTNNNEISSFEYENIYSSY